MNVSRVFRGSEVHLAAHSHSHHPTAAEAAGRFPHCYAWHL